MNLLFGNFGTARDGERGRERDRTLGGRLSLAADFFHLGRGLSKDRSGSERSDSNRGGKLTWNLFRRTDKSRERDNKISLNTKKLTVDDVVCRNIHKRH